MSKAIALHLLRFLSVVIGIPLLIGVLGISLAVAGPLKVMQVVIGAFCGVVMVCVLFALLIMIWDETA